MVTAMLAFTVKMDLKKLDSVTDSAKNTGNNQGLAVTAERKLSGLAANLE